MMLEVDIKKRLGDFRLDVKFNTENATTAILGASGCGKSMTLRCIAGIETPDEGRIVLDGRVLFDSARKINLPPQKRAVGYMFQDYALFPHMTVEQNVLSGSKLKTLEPGYLGRFHLEGLSDYYPSQLSGGQKQRVALARMLASEPELILLDEPFSALDSHLKWSMEKELSEIIADANKPTIFVSHNRDEVYRLCDFVGAMVHGKMSGVEPVKDFFHNPRTRAAAILSGCKNVSYAKKVGPTTVSVPGWKVTLYAGRPIPFEEGYVGIRAHYLERVDAGALIASGVGVNESLRTYVEKKQNVFTVKEHEVIEEPFEWIISFRDEGAEEWIQWRISKDLWNYNADTLPEYFSIPSEHILLLEE